MKALVTLALCLFSTIAFAADPASPAATGTAPEWMKYTMPGEGHKMMADLAGSWNYTMKMWMDAKAKPQESKGTSEVKWIMGGRYLQEDVKGMAMGKPFNGMSMMGYDMFMDEYQTMWMDDMSTSMMMMKGKRDMKSKPMMITMTGMANDPMRNMKNVQYRSVMKMMSKNEHMFEMYTMGADGKEFKSMEMKYKRMK